MAQAGQLGGDEVSAGTLLLGLGPRWGKPLFPAPAVVDGQFAASFGEILEIVEINFSESFQQVFVPPNLGPRHIERVALFLKGTAWFFGFLTLRTFHLCRSGAGQLLSAPTGAQLRMGQVWSCA